MRAIIRSAFIVCLALTACGRPGEYDPSATGTFFFRFAVADKVRRDSDLRRPLLGTVYGTIYRSGDVAFWGPFPGAKGVGDIKVTDVNLETESTSLESAHSPELPAGEYVFLGLLDLDGSGDQPNGEPVTGPSTNEFEIVPGTEGKRPILFDLIH